VQTALLQDEALKRANARIEELQAQASGPQPDERQTSFLDSVREAFGGRSQQSAQQSAQQYGQQRGSVPSVRAGAASQGGYQAQTPPPNYAPQPGYAPQMPPAGYGASPFGGGGSFLGTAASSAAGVIGGALLLDGIRSMFGHRGYGPSAFGAVPEDRTSPWGSGDTGDHTRSASDNDLARQAGIDHIGDAHNDANTAASTDDTLVNDNDTFTTTDDDVNNADDSDYGGDNSDFGDSNMDSGGSYDA
jgi:uncharacterized protein